MQNLFNWRHELTLQEMLSDPLVIAMMEADGVDPQELEAMLTGFAASIAAREASIEPPFAPSTAPRAALLPPRLMATGQEV